MFFIENFFRFVGLFDEKTTVLFFSIENRLIEQVAIGLS